MARTDSRGMVVVEGVTYRIERSAPHTYLVVRLLDDVEVGTFRTRPALRVQSSSIDVNVLRDVVRAALKSARTSAVMHAAPVSPPEEPPLPITNAAPAHRPSQSTNNRPPGTQPPARTPSSAPPAAPIMA